MTMKAEVLGVSEIRFFQASTINRKFELEFLEIKSDGCDIIITVWIINEIITR